jgi:hypothetical protein
LLVQEFFIVALDLFERRIGGRTNDAGVILALIPQFLVDAVMEIVEPPICGGFWGHFFEELCGALAAELARQDIFQIWEKVFRFIAFVMGN